jgi:transcriptional regulator with XRE-family HTH domain
MPKHKERSQIGLTIRQLRKERDLSQRELANFAQVSFSFLNRVENGDLNITLSTLNKILAVFKRQAGVVLLPPVDDEDDTI